MSEFGSGYATCLRQFLNHRKRLDDYEKQFRALPGMGPIEMWFNASSDHLYGLKRPIHQRKDWLFAKGLAERALYIGHGFHQTSFTRFEAEQLLDLAETILANLNTAGYKTATLAEAMETDRLLGLKPEEGDFSCALDLPKMGW